MLLSLQLSSFLFELFSGLEFTDNTFPTVCNILALHFHQWSWLGIACLRCGHLFFLITVCVAYLAI